MIWSCFTALYNIDILPRPAGTLITYAAATVAAAISGLINKHKLVQHCFNKNSIYIYTIFHRHSLAA